MSMPFARPYLMHGYRAAQAILAAAVAAGCASQPSPATSSAPAAPPVTKPSVSQTCPDPSDGPSIIAQAIEDARRGMAADPTGPTAPACLITAFARIQTVVPDSLNEHALAIAAELDRRAAPSRELLSSEIVLLSHAHRYADVSRAYARLAAIDPQPRFEVMRDAIVAAHQTADTAALLRLLTAAEARPEAPAAIRMEANVLRQVSALRAAITEARGFIRQNPKYLTAYPSLVGNFGTLGVADSVVAYIGRGLRQGVTRAALTAGLDPFVNTMLRHALLYRSAFPWTTEIAAATRVDSALSTPSTKFLIAALIVQGDEVQLEDLGPQVDGSTLAPGMAAAASEAAQRRGAACAKVAPLLSSLDVAAAALRGGGDRFAAAGVAQVTAAMNTERDRLTALRDVCARPAR